MIRVVAFLVLAGALAGAAFWVYVRAEPPVSARLPLAGLRAGALVVLLALLFDLRLPWGGAGDDAPRWALLDASASMSAAGGAAWTAASARAADLVAEGWTVVPFGEGVGLVGGRPWAPAELHTQLAPALVRAAEAGARQVRVLSDLRFEDPAAVALALAAAPVTVTFEPFGGEVPNAGLGPLRVADHARRGDPVEAEVELFAEGAGDSLQVEIREEGSLVVSRAVATPAPGRRARATLPLPPPRGEGRLRYTARVMLAGDAFPSDDEAVAYMTAGREEGGLVLVSLRPDWEARVLLSVLGEATGLPATGYLRVGPDRFAPMGRALQRGSPRDSAAVRAAAQGAAVLVLHGLDARSDAWSRSLARRASRVLHWPGDAAGAAAAGVTAGAPQGGEWYPVSDARPSPLAGDLPGVALRELPPLTGVLPVEGAPSGTVPLELQLGGTGPGRAALVLDAAGGARRAVVLSSGFWRWAARDGAPRDAYRRLWSGVGGWLLAEDRSAAGGDVRPERWVSPAGRPVAWRIPLGGPDSVRLEILGAEGGSVLDTILVRAAGAGIPPLPAGAYRYRASGGDGAMGEGRFDVEARSEEMLPRPAVPAPPANAVPGSAGGGLAGAGSVDAAGAPLRRSPWPYLLVLLLLSAEWVGRRRAGLR
ncbi:MAG TPA: hypothetical protein VLH75_01990 [Longimicrobiales bacterium]|nr:hypothetical protein [Longimicrobiales bacterium]